MFGLLFHLDLFIIYFPVYGILPVSLRNVDAPALKLVLTIAVCSSPFSCVLVRRHIIS